MLIDGFVSNCVSAPASERGFLWEQRKTVNKGVCGDSFSLDVLVILTRLHSLLWK